MFSANSGPTRLVITHAALSVVGFETSILAVELRPHICVSTGEVPQVRFSDDATTTVAGRFEMIVAEMEL